MNNHYWNGIRSFVLVAEHGSFTAAADVSGLSKASLSQQVSALEQSLGVQLLHRTTRSLRLTDAGDGYYQMCKQGLAQFDSAKEWVSQANQKLQGTIRMNAVGGLLGEQLITPLLIAFQQQHPQIDVDLDFSSHHVDLMSDRYDVVMRMGSMADSSLVARRLHSITTRYVASPDFIARHGTPSHPTDLLKFPMICGSVTEWQFVNQEERLSIDFTQGFKIANGRVMLQAAKAGLGVARLPDIYVQAGIAQGVLVEVLPQWSHSTPLSLVCPPARYQLQRVKTLMDWLIEGFEQRYLQALLQQH